MEVKVIFSSGGKYNKNTQQKIADSDTKDGAKKIVGALIEKGHHAEIVKITPEKTKSVKDIKADVVFNLVEWSGRDYPLALEVLQTLEASKIPYTGSDSKSYEWCCDKISMKKMFDLYKIPTPKWTSITPSDTKTEIKRKIAKLKFPIIVKPAYEHCAIGITKKSVINYKKDAIGRISKLISNYTQPVLVEEFIKGREFNSTVLKNHVLHVFPPSEVIFKTRDPLKILSFNLEWLWGGEKYDAAIVQEKKLSNYIKSLSKKIFVKMGCKGYVRIDMRMRGSKIYILEVNINPSLFPDDFYGLTASTRAEGWNFTKLVDEVANAALEN